MASLRGGGFGDSRQRRVRGLQWHLPKATLPRRLLANGIPMACNRSACKQSRSAHPVRAPKEDHWPCHWLSAAHKPRATALAWERGDFQLILSRPTPPPRRFCFAIAQSRSVAVPWVRAQGAHCGTVSHKAIACHLMCRWRGAFGGGDPSDDAIGRRVPPAAPRLWKSICFTLRHPPRRLLAIGIIMVLPLGVAQAVPQCAPRARTQG